jgi:flagellar biosynthesis protein FlhA
MRLRAAITTPLLLVSVVLMMVVPVSAFVIDILLAANITFAVLTLLGALVVKDSLEFSVFPSLLLVSTLARLALNVSSTRLILLDGYAGKVIETFGSFVIGSSVVVGLVVFLILIVIQFVVITNGAGRVAEVAARFTLDAMPGKQMAIDADLTSGLINEEQARELRKRIAKEADFYGAMDGASKFVKGDAIAGIVIVTINLIGGLAIGVGSKGLGFGEAIDTYSRLSVGDGLVSQIPALLISIATGLLVTRVGSERALGGDLAAQILGNQTALRIGAILIAGLGLLPGLPKIPFFGLAAVLAALGRRPRVPAPNEEADAIPQIKVQPDDPEAIIGRIRVEPLELHLSYDILDLIDPARGGDLMERVRSLRRQLADELGIVLPLLRARDDAALPPSVYRILLRGTEVGRGRAPRDRVLAIPMGDPAGLANMGGERTTEPVFGLEAYWLPDNARAMAAATGATVVDRSSAVITHLAEIVRRQAAELLSRQDVQMLVEGLRAEEPILANEVGTDHLSLAMLHQVLRGLLSEGVSIRDIGRIVEAISAKSVETRSLDALIRTARVALGASILGKLAPEGRLAVVTLEPGLEAAYHEALREAEGEVHLVLEPVRVDHLCRQASRLMGTGGGLPVALVCSQALRKPLRRTLMAAGVDLAVVAYPELPSHLSLSPIGVIGDVEPARS